MSCLESDKINNTLLDEFEKAFVDDDGLRDALAYRLLEGLEYYLYCKEDAYHYLEDYYDTVLEAIFKEYWSGNYMEIDIRELCKAAYDLQLSCFVSK